MMKAAGPAETIAQTRAEELDEAPRITGVDIHEWLPYKDGYCAEISEAEVNEQLGGLIMRYQPDTILTFPPDGVTGHPVHQAVSRWCTLSVLSAAKPIRLLYCVCSARTYKSHLEQMDEKLDIYYNVDRPVVYQSDESYICLTLPADVLDKKRRTLEAMPSQTAVMMDSFPFNFIGQAFSEELYVFSSTVKS